MFQTSVFTVLSLLSLWIIPVTCTGNATFRCNSGSYIYDRFFCDGGKDCDGGEDEAYSCQSSCGRESFKCDGTQCKNITVRCNTLKDCEDGTDELNCGDEIDVKNCSSQDKFLCYDGLRCLDLELTCDGSCNCFDCSDENSNCTKQDFDLQKRCPETYFAGANGPLCLCESRDNQSNNTLCNRVESCPGEYLCDQRCIKYRSRTMCMCYEGYHKISNNKCKNEAWYENFIIYSTALKIKSLNMTSNKNSVVQSEVHSCTALTAAKNYVYYATLLPNNRGGIFKSPITSGKADVLVETDFPINSIAVDYVTNNVYFTSNGSLSVCSGDGRICSRLKCCGVDYVAIAPKSGWMFYLQSHSMHSQSENLLMRSNMDGSNETIFTDDVYENGGADFSIVVDESISSISTLYVLTTKNKEGQSAISKISFDGEYKQTVFSTLKIHGLAVLDNIVYFLINQKSDIFHSNALKNFWRFYAYASEESISFRDNGTSYLKHLFAYNGLSQRRIENPCNESSCSGLCLIKPTISPRSALGYTCVCNSFIPNGDNRWCTDHPEQSSGHSAVWIVVGILILMILAGSAVYYFSKKFNLHYEHPFLRIAAVWQRGRRNSRVINISNEEE